jgi:predicted nuclease of predicted toxin-antitoxin system
LQEAGDDEILGKAIELDRVLVTLDEDFGDWAILPLSRHPGVVSLKVVPTSTEMILSVLVPFLGRHAGASFTNHLVIVKPNHVRWIKTA